MAQLLGPDGRPIEKRLLTREVSAPTISGVRSPLGGFPSRGLTPTKLARILRDAAEHSPKDYLELAEEMEEKDLHYLSVVGTRKRSVAQLDIRVEPASDATEDVAAAELVQAFVDREELEDELFDVLDAVGKGFSVTEIVWETSEGQWMPGRLSESARDQLLDLPFAAKALVKALSDGFWARRGNG